MTTESNHPHPDQLIPIEGLTGAFITKDNVALYEVHEELERIRSRHGPLASNHEGLGVLMEEFDELQREIYKRPTSFRPDLMRAEAIQVAAVATRIASDLAHDESKLNPRTVLMRDQAEAQCDRMRDRALEAERDLKEHRRTAAIFVLGLAKVGLLQEKDPGSDELTEAMTQSAEDGAALMDLLGLRSGTEVPT